MLKSAKYSSFLLAGSMIAFCLSCERNENPDVTDEFLFLEDSSYTYLINTEGDSNLIERWYYAYDSYGRRISSFGYTQSWMTGYWFGTTRTETDYNSSGNIVKLTSYSWENDDWGPASIQNEYTYDSLGRISSRTYFYNKQFYYYSSEGGQDSTLGYIWNKYSNQWTLIRKSLDSTNNDRNVVQSVFYDLDTVSGIWSITGKEETEYDKFGNKKIFSKYEFYNNQWECYYRRERIFADEKNLGMELLYGKTSGMPLSLVRSAQYSYDKEGRIVSRYHTALHNGTIESQTMETFNYNSSGVLKLTNVNNMAHEPYRRINSVVSFTSRHQMNRTDAVDPGRDVIFERLYREWQLLLQ
jgi:hypothetical protein